MDGLSGSKNQVPESGGEPETKGVESASYLHPTIDKCQVLVSSYVVVFFNNVMFCFVFNKFALCNDHLLSFTFLIEKVTGAQHKHHHQLIIFPHRAWHHRPTRWTATSHLGQGHRHVTPLQSLPALKSSFPHAHSNASRLLANLTMGITEQHSARGWWKLKGESTLKPHSCRTQSNLRAAISAIKGDSDSAVWHTDVATANKFPPTIIRL